MSIYVCIDLKSFYASVECVERGLDPFGVNLVVADASRGDGAITLAISPAMKALGVKNRCRIFEIPKHIEYITAMPRMKRYMEVSAQIYGIYLRYIAPEDIHVYSIDEVFIDATAYLHLYQCTPKQLVQMLTGAVMQETGICATAGVGTNLYLAKVAMDIIAKKVPEHIGFLTEESYRRLLWQHRPLTDFWNVGRGTAKRLAEYGVFDMQGITQLPEELLYRIFGVKAEYLIDHAWGREPCTMADIHNYKGESRSLSNSQILFEDYDCQDAEIILTEMVDNLVLELVESNLYAEGIHLYIRYAKDTIASTGASRKLVQATCSFRELREAFRKLYWEKVRVGYPIRQIGIGLERLTYEPCIMQSFFDDTAQDEKEEKLQRAVIGVKHRFGKNAVMRGISYLDRATGRQRNLLVGGHNGEIRPPRELEKCQIPQDISHMAK